MTATMAKRLTVPGVYDIPADVYHADPVEGGSLSSTGARKLLRCPARFRYDQDHPEPYRKTFDVGSAAHRLALGEGADFEVVDGERWDTKVAKATVADVRAAGKVPLKAAEADRVHAMADALRKHPVAARLLDPSAGGQPEQTIIWRDEETGVWRRAMLDWLPATYAGRRLVVPDYKTTVSADPTGLDRTVANFGYHQQAAWYLDAVKAVGLAPEPEFEPAFVFIAQEKEPPYLVTVFQLDETALAVGAERNRRALERYRDCAASGFWPGYTTDIPTISLPRWAERQYQEDISDY